MRDTPVIEIHIVDSDAAQRFGMGEPPVPPIVPAIATRFLQQLEHGSGDCRFGPSNSNRVPPNE